MDSLTPDQRSRAMRSNKGKDTMPEILVRKAIHAKGFRYSLHRKDLPGKPDIVLPRCKAVIEIKGCYWHGHGCRSLSPSTNSVFWKAKIERNQTRDAINEEKLLVAGWRVCNVWECALRGKGRLGIEQVSYLISEWLNSDDLRLELIGKK